MVQIPGDRILRHEIDGSKIRARRKKMGLALTDIFLKIYEKHGVKIHPQTIQTWETGKSYPTVKRLEFLADVLLVTPEFFYADKN